MKEERERLQLKRRVPSLRNYNEIQRLGLKVFNNGETAIAYRTLDELDAYGKIVVKFEENFEHELKSLCKYGLDALIFN